LSAAVDAEEKMTEEEFVLRAIVRLRKPGYKGIHSVYSGFNEAFRRYFGQDPVAATSRLASQGKIIMRPAKRGVMLYLPEDGVPTSPSPEEALKKILDDE
jgi:hypothetical protein